MHFSTYLFFLSLIIGRSIFIRFPPSLLRHSLILSPFRFFSQKANHFWGETLWSFMKPMYYLALLVVKFLKSCNCSDTCNRIQNARLIGGARFNVFNCHTKRPRANSESTVSDIVTETKHIIKSWIFWFVEHLRLVCEQFQKLYQRRKHLKWQEKYINNSDFVIFLKTLFAI